MKVAEVELHSVRPFDHAVFPFSDDDGSPRNLTVVHGAGGVGKTALLQAIASTRPGNATAQQPWSSLDLAVAEPPQPKTVPHVRTRWSLGQDDPDRPHTLSIVSPNARLYDSDEQESFRRREQALFDRAARDRGFAFLLFPSARWYSRQPLVLNAPGRTMTRYDVRAPATPEDRPDFARETKQALVYAVLAATLGRGTHRELEALSHAMRHAVNVVGGLTGLTFEGADPVSLEPVFRASGGSLHPYDALPTRARHLISFAALTTRVLWAAYPRHNPLEAEGVVAIDDVDLHQDQTTLSDIPGALERALPAVQWILTASSPVVAEARDLGEVMVLRRHSESERVELYVGEQARTH
jgi:hypothetical protein